MSLNLISFPVEIIAGIAEFLPTDDLSNLRLTCKRLCGAVFHQPFGRDFFVKKQFMFTEGSLEALINIAKDPELGKKLKHLIFGLDRYDHSPFLRFDDKEKEKAYVYGRESQDRLLANGAAEARNMLAKALSDNKLHKLTTIDIRDYRNPERKRDNCNWNSLGSTTVMRQTGRELIIRNSRGHFNMANTVFSSVVNALARTNRTHSVAIETVIRYSPGLSGSAFELIDSTTESELGMMKKLHLCLDLFVLSGTELQKFLSHTSSLIFLRLNFGFGSTQLATLRLFVDWMALPPSVQEQIRFTAPLKTLEIGRVTLGPDRLRALILRFSDTLEEFSLRRVRLIVSLQQFKDKEDPWAELLSDLAAEKALPHLRAWSLAHLQVWLDRERLLAKVNFGWRIGGPLQDGDGPMTGRSAGDTGRVAGPSTGITVAAKPEKDTLAEQEKEEILELTHKDGAAAASGDAAAKLATTARTVLNVEWPPAADLLVVDPSDAEEGSAWEEDEDEDEDDSDDSEESAAD